MKSNHNIDKLFSQKLNSLEAAPSADAWLKLEKNLQEKNKSKKRIIWLPYAAAAVITLLIVSVWLVNGWEKGGKENVANVLKEPPQTPPRDKTELSVTEPAAEKSGTTTPADKKEPLLAAAQKKSNRITRRPVKEVAIKEEKKITSVTPINTEKDTAPAIKAIEAEDKIALQKPAITVNKPAQPTSVVVVVQIDASEVPATTAAFNEEEGTDEVSKKTRAGKILAKLKKIKKADFGDLGIHRESIVAFVKDKTGKN